MSRLENIDSVRRRAETEIQALPEGDISSRVGKQVRITGEALKRRILRRVASPIVRLLQKRVRREVEFDLSFHADVLTIGERFANDMTLQKLLDRLGPVTKMRVLIVGCYIGGEDVQFWLRRGVAALYGVDVYDLTATWQAVTPVPAARWGRPLCFQQASVEQLPFVDESFDLIFSDAVMEHVRNLSAAAREMARVLKPRGMALHSFGPLYTTFGGDHCIAAFGADHGYDHLLLEETEYRNKLANRDLFRDVTGDENMAFWAENDQFSFARPSDYVHIFSSHLEIAFTLLKISEEGLAFRRRRPDLWAELRGLGLAEEDLLVKSIVCILRKRE